MIHKIVILLFIISGCFLANAEEDYRVVFSSSNFGKERKFIYNKNKETFDLLKKMNRAYFIGIDSFDINNDGLKDFIVSFQSTFHCGAGSAGCPTEIYISKPKNSWQLLHGFRSLGKIDIQKHTVDGYHNIKVYGGTQHIPNDFVWEWNGQKFKIINSGE